MPPNRDALGRFVKGQSGNPGGRPKLPEEFKQYARQSPQRLRAIADDPDTPVKVKADIERWFVEMFYGKSPQQMTVDGNVQAQNAVKVKFEGELAEWSK